jgi:hypothetical protein
MFKNLTAVIAGTFIALANGPAFAQGMNVGEAITDLGTNLDTLQGDIDNLRNFVEPKAIFVSSSEHTGALGGLEGADGICQGLADASIIVPEGEYVALLSDDDIHASARLTPSIGPYVRPDGVPVAENFAALFGTGRGASRFLINQPNVDESGFNAANPETWTGTLSTGIARGGADRNCMNWTVGDVVTSEEGWVGVNNAVFDGWIDIFQRKCDVPSHIYCVQR